MIFLFFKKIGFLGILGPPYCGIGATIRIGREIRCLPYAGFFYLTIANALVLLTLNMIIERKVKQGTLHKLVFMHVMYFLNEELDHVLFIYLLIVNF